MKRDAGRNAPSMPRALLNECPEQCGIDAQGAMHGRTDVTNEESSSVEARSHVSIVRATKRSFFDPIPRTLRGATVMR